MTDIKQMPGIQPELRKYLSSIESALAGDIVMVIDPETTGSAATTADFTRDVRISIENAAGDVHTWLTKAYTTTSSIGEVTAGDGTASIVSTTLSIVAGKAVVTVSCTDTWAADDTNTLTIANITVLGVTVTGGTSVDTIV
jgi:hypothetical protein